MLPWQLFTLFLAHVARASDDAAFVTLLLWQISLWVLDAIYLAFVAVAFRTCTGWVPAPDQAVLQRFD